MKIGDRVAYSAAWLRSTGQFTGPMPAARGVVKELKKLGETTLATVDWGDPDIPAKVNTRNLAIVGGRGFSAD